MRMWMVDPAILCRQHLLGEHLELHMFVGTINKGHSLWGYVNNNLCDPSSIISRHDALVKEIEKRGYNHQSPLYLEKQLPCHPINIKTAQQELLTRCSECSKRLGEAKNEY